MQHFVLQGNTDSGTQVIVSVFRSLFTSCKHFTHPSDLSNLSVSLTVNTNTDFYLEYIYRF